MGSGIKTYLPPAGITASAVMIGVGEQALFSTPLITPTMWFYLAGLSSAFFLGTLWADLWNPRSHLRSWWQDRFAFGDFQPITQKMVYPDRGPNHGGQRAETAITARFIFRKRTRIRDVRVTVIKRRLGGAGLNPAFEKNNYRPALSGEYEGGDAIDIPIAFIPVDPNHPGYYGDEGAAHIGTFMEFLFTVEIFSSRRERKARLFLRTPISPNFSWPADCHYGNRYFLISEGYDPFDGAPFDSYEG